MKRICIICARGGSKGVPRKNVKIIGGKPLIAHSIEHGLQSGMFDKVLVSSDDDEILEVAKEFGADILKRPDELASDTAGTMQVLKHALDYAEVEFNTKYDTMVLLQPTSPIRDITDINQAIEKLEKNKISSVISVKEASASPYYVLIEKGDDGVYGLSKKSDAIRRQDVPIVYEINGSFYVWNRDSFMNEQKVLQKDTDIQVIPEERSVDIDTPFDFKMASLLMDSLIAEKI